jgi:cytochrome c oxidase subunit 1
MSYTNTLTRYLDTTGHKLVGWMYGYAGYVGGVYGFSCSVWMRIELGSPGLGVIRKQKEAFMYNSWITGHGLSMLFLFVMPIAIGAYGNYLLPMMIGSSELVMPRLNGASIYLLGSSVVTLLLCAVSCDRPACSGWTLYPPLSTRDADSLSVATDLSLLSVHLLGLSSALGAINFLATLRHMKHSGLTTLGCGMLPIAIGVTSILLVGALPVLGVAVTGLLMDRNYSGCIYDGSVGGDPVLYQHLFWFFGHPEVYVIIVPVFGIVSTTLGAICHGEVFGREGMTYCMVSIGIVGFCVWAHHMFTAGLDLDTRAYFSAATAVVAIPTSVKVFSYTASLVTTKYGLASSTIALAAFLTCFTLGGLTGLMLSSVTLDTALHDTYFVVAHFHTVLSLGAVFGILVGNYASSYIWNATSVQEASGCIHVTWLLMGALLVFGPMHTQGLNGLCRRIPEYADVHYSNTLAATLGLLCLILSTIVQGRLAYTASVSVSHNTVR